MSARSIVCAVSLLGLFACGPTAPAKSESVNVVWPPSATKAERSFWTNSPSVALLEKSAIDQNVGHRLVAAFNDSAGYYRQLDRFLAPLDHPTLDGIAISDDYGKTWTRPTPRLPNDGRNPFFGALLGSPWVSSNKTAVLYTSLAGVRTDGGWNPDRIAVSVSYDGVGWSYPFAAVKHSGEYESIGWQSNSYAGETAVIAYSLFRRGEPAGIFLATSDSYGSMWAPPQDLGDSRRAFSRVVVRLVSSRSGYIAYSTFSDTGSRELRVSRITRSETLDDWSISDLFSMNYAVNVAVPIRASNDTFWFDSMPFSFDIGNVNESKGTAKLFLALASNTSSGQPTVRLASCKDEEGCEARANWHLDDVGSVAGRSIGQHQPVVAPNPLNEDVAVSWYEDAGFVSGDVNGLTVRGRRCIGGGAFGPVISVDDRKWAACPEAERPNRYSDFIASIMTPEFHQADQQPLVVTLYSNSSGSCDPFTTIPPSPTFDQHVEAARW